MIARSLGIAAGMIGLAATGHAEPGLADSGPCAPRDVVVARLAEVYDETRRSVELAGARAMVEVFASDVSGSWTVTVTRPGGLTCLIASGRGYEGAPGGVRRAAGRDA